jgi:hypothetical protein
MAHAFVALFLIQVAVCNAELGGDDITAVCTAAVVSDPKELDDEGDKGLVENLDVECLLAQFGPQKVAAGNIVFADPSDGCEIEKQTVGKSLIANSILLVDRGTCSFAQKALQAQKAGAAAVIVSNTDDKELFFMADPTGEGKGLTIPTALISKSASLKLREAASKFTGTNSLLERVEFEIKTKNGSHQQTRLNAETADDLMDFILGSAADTVLVGFANDKGNHEDYPKVAEHIANVDFPMAIAPFTMATEFGPADLEGDKLPVMVSKADIGRRILF